MSGQCVNSVRGVCVLRRSHYVRAPSIRVGRINVNVTCTERGQAQLISQQLPLHASRRAEGVVAVEERSSRSACRDRYGERRALPRRHLCRRVLHHRRWERRAHLTDEIYDACFGRLVHKLLHVAILVLVAREACCEYLYNAAHVRCKLRVFRPCLEQRAELRVHFACLDLVAPDRELFERPNSQMVR